MSSIVSRYRGALRRARVLIPLAVVSLGACQDEPTAPVTRIPRPKLAVLAVTNTNDNGLGSLRQAIADASPGDTIDLSGVSGTIGLTSGQLTIDKNLAIKGPGANVLSIARSSATAFRIVQITAGIVNISGLTITGGMANAKDPGGPNGGGIHVSGGATLNLSECQVSENAATSIGFGGGIQVFEAKANIDRCTIHSNTAPSGGAGINSNTSTVRLVNSTVSKNVTPGTGGGLLIMSHKIGVPASLNLVYTTVTTNVAAEGAGVHMFGVDVKNFDLKSSIMSGNIVTTAGAPVDISNPFGGSVITADHSLVETGGIPAGNGNIVGVAAKLGNLVYNGGTTMTHELLTGSPGMDAADNALCTIDPVNARDQAGHKRPHGAQCDMGSFEGDSPGNYPPTALVGGPYTGDEGSPITVKFAGDDPDDDPITFFWDFGNGVSGSGPVPPTTYTYPDNPSGQKTEFVVTLIVKDKYGAYDMKTTTATITNVVPTVTASLSATTIVSGSQVQLTGSFTDPGVLDAPWNYEINWGVGLKPQGTVKLGASIIDSRQYCAVGVYAPLLAVTDKDGGKGTKALSLTVTPFGAQVALPGSVSLNGGGGGTVTATVLSTKTFDAVATVDAATATLGGPVGPRVGIAKKQGGGPMVGTADANNDGLMDLVLHFDRAALVKAGAITASTTQLVVRATLKNGCTQIEAAGPINVVP